VPPYDVNQIDEPLAEMWTESMKAKKEADDIPDGLVKKPEAFKKDTKWKLWKESVVTYLHSRTGQASIPLAYIVRDRDIPVPGTVYATVHDRLVNQAIL
jgi:hypothetical protein